MEKEKIDKNLIWKILAFLFLGILIGVIFQAKYISAIEWPMNKDATCLMFNKTGVDCETYWCNSIRGGDYNSSLEICKFVINESIIINETIYVNQTLNVSDINLSEIEARYLNKTQVEELLNNKTGDLRDSFGENYVTKQEFSLSQFSQNSDKSDFNFDAQTILVIVIIGGVLVFVFLKTQNQITPPAVQRGEAPMEYRKLQSQKTTKDLGIENQLNKLSEKLEKIEEENKESKKQKTKKEEAKKQKMEEDYESEEDEEEKDEDY